MGFRWIALVALWTMLSGPILAVPTCPGPVKAGRKAMKKVVKVRAHQTARR
jgi:hypothetical protein